MRHFGRSWSKRVWRNSDLSAVALVKAEAYCAALLKNADDAEFTLGPRESAGPGGSSALRAGSIQSAIKLIFNAFALFGARIRHNCQILDMVCDGRPKVETFRENGLAICEH